MVTKISFALFFAFLGVICLAQSQDITVSRLSNDINSYVCEEQEQTSDNLTEWIDRLEQYECRNCPVGYNRIDVNGELSYGCLQFQMATFKEQVNLLYEVDTSNFEQADWENLIYSCDFQKRLAYKMIEYDCDNWQHWRTSVAKRGLGVPPIP